MTALPEHIGRYQILGLLGTGGMAEILLARVNGPSGFERPVVIKRILPHLAREQRFRDMFLDEARIVAGIRHQNVVNVHELGQEGNDLYLVMEYLEGESASTLARRLASNRKLLNFGLCAHLMAEIAAGLHAAHQLEGPDGESQGLVHRDVSPANVFLTYTGGVKMIDFGIAVAADRVSRTEAGQVKGKYAYMSPEQCMGVQLDRRSDVFSMGIVLYELSTCRRLFKRQSDMLTLQAICHEEVIPPSQLVPEYPPELERVCLKALSKALDQRYQSAQEMRRDLIEVSRQLNGSKIPEESLAKVMRRLFPDRIEEKRALLTKLRAGERVAELPAADVDEQIEIESVQAGILPNLSMLHSVTMAASSPLRASTGTGTGSASQPSLTSLPGSADAVSYSVVAGAEGTGSISRSDLRPSPRAPSEPSIDLQPGLRPYRKALWAGGLLAAAFVLVGTMAITTMSERRADADVQARETRQVEFTVATAPEGAEVLWGGELKGKSPVSFKVDRSMVRNQLELRLEGYESIRERLVPDRDQRLRLVLPALPEPEPEPVAEVAAPAPKPAPRRRPVVRTPRPAPKPAPTPQPVAEKKRPAKEEKKAENPYARFN